MEKIALVDCAWLACKKQSQRKHARNHKQSHKRFRFLTKTTSIIIYSRRLRAAFKYWLFLPGPKQEWFNDHIALGSKSIDSLVHGYRTELLFYEKTWLFQVHDFWFLLARLQLFVLQLFDLVKCLTILMCYCRRSPQKLRGYRDIRPAFKILFDVLVP